MVISYNILIKITSWFVCYLQYFTRLALDSVGIIPPGIHAKHPKKVREENIFEYTLNYHKQY